MPDDAVWMCDSTTSAPSSDNNYGNRAFSRKAAAHAAGPVKGSSGAAWQLQQMPRTPRKTRSRRTDPYTCAHTPERTPALQRTLVQMSAKGSCAKKNGVKDGNSAKDSSAKDSCAKDGSFAKDSDAKDSCAKDGSFAKDSSCTKASFADALTDTGEHECVLNKKQAEFLGAQPTWLWRRPGSAACSSAAYGFFQRVQL
eukprot:365609-Chlamydomonas_euryale.AAC.11